MRRSRKPPTAAVPDVPTAVADAASRLDGLLQHYGRPDAIITSDIEIRDYAPICRTDDFVVELRRKLRWIKTKQKRCGGCPVLDGGDVFDKRYRTDPSYSVVNLAVEYLPEPFITVPGNHDLPYHAIENFDQSAISVLATTNRIKVVTDSSHPLAFDNLDIYGFPYRLPTVPPRIRRHAGRYAVALVHAYVYSGPRPAVPGISGAHAAGTLLDLFQAFDLIVCGHNHLSFVAVGDDGKPILVNPGSLMRTDADQADHQPRIFLWWAERRLLESLNVPIATGVVSREHIEQADAHEARFDAFISKLGQADSGDGTTDPVSFEDNLALLLQQAPEDVRSKVVKYCEAGGLVRGYKKKIP